MAPVQLDGNDLGEKHKHFNQLVKEAIAEKKTLDTNELDSDDSDIYNLINIDVANENRDVDYVVKILTCGDMLYVTRALKKCDWLIVDDQYAHLINPEYLDATLYPRMQTKAIKKLKQLIRLKLKNETRVEQFYNFEQKTSEALKWLPNCSLNFIENNFNKHVQKINISLLKRLCEKSLMFLELYSKSDNYSKKEAFQETLFLLHVDINKFLDILESESKYYYPRFGKRATKILMTRCPQRIIDKFGDYCLCIDTPTFVKYLKKEDIKQFLLTEAVNTEKKRNQFNFYFNNLKNWKVFINAIPITERFEFVKQVFIDEILIDENAYTEEEKAINMLRIWQTPTPIYHWYQFAPFDLAFSNIKSMIGPETTDRDKNLMFQSLLSSVEGNLEHIKLVLQYFRDKQINSTLDTKRQFLNNLISKFSTSIFDNDSWNILEDIIKTTDIYNSVTNDSITEAILLYKILHNENIPDRMKKLFEFNSLKTYQSSLDTKEKQTVFDYLFNLIWNKLQNTEITSVTEFQQCVDLLEKTLALLKDWEKTILEYPLVLEKIRHLVKIKQERSWTVNMSALYNLHKPWRRYMFDESVVLFPTEEACINSLKHGPNLLELYKHEIETMFLNDAITLRRLLNKVRIYWPNTFNRNWRIVYLNALDQTEGHNALTRGLCILLPRSQLIHILKKYAPNNSKIDWSKIQELELSLQRCFAKNMHFARPQPSFETILLYAKGDYLQYALPSLLGIYYNLSCMQSQESVPKLLDAPVSLQKHGIRLVFTKLSPDKLKETFSVLWKKNKNSTIRTEIFKITFNLLCNEKNDLKIKDNWILLEMFIDNLTFRENKEIYKLLYKIEDIPQSVQAPYLMKSYKFLKTLITNNKNEYLGYEWDVRKLARYSRKIMESVPPQFVADIILEFTINDFFETNVDRFDMTQLISSYLLCAKDEETQIKKYEEVLSPILRRSFELWNNIKNEEYYVKLNFEQIISNLIYDLKHFAVEKNMIVPVKMFSMILIEMERSLILSENYILLRTWKLTTELVTLLDKNQPIDWEQTSFKIAQEFGRFCLECLKEDSESCFSCIYVLFTRALGVFKSIFSENVQHEIYNCLVENEDLVYGYLAALKLLKLLYSDEIAEKVKEFREKIRKHPSVEVKMHYYDVFQEERASLFTGAQKKTGFN